MNTRLNQQGLALLIMIFILSLIAAGYIFKSLDSNEIKNERNRKTAESLAQAKAALLAFAATQNLTTSGSCGNNCPRPGDLPCPDRNNDGVSESSCGNVLGTTGQAERLGRLPWKTLGLPDLRDSEGERLWYAVSNRYKNNHRFNPLNSDTIATITLRDKIGNIIFDGESNGLVALIIAPGANLIRQDGISQVRDGANQVITSNYLDIAYGEDNQDFVDDELNGFIEGPVIIMNGADRVTIVNDVILSITNLEINQAMESRVLAEVKKNISAYYSGPGALSYPYPANFNDTSCLGNGEVTNCLEGTSAHGRIPANPATPWGVTSILNGTSDNNWFQLNSWREVIHYAVAPACSTGTSGCGGVGVLTLNNPFLSPANGKQVILIATGAKLAGQDRAGISKSAELNFIEGENLTPLDDVYERTMPLTTINNDRAISIP